MPLGLPSRTPKTTTERDTTPLFSPASQSSATRPSSTRRVTSVGHGEVHVVGLEAGGDGAALVTGGAVRRLELHVRAGVGLLELRRDVLVRGLGDGEAHDVDRVLVRVVALGIAAARGQCQHTRQGCRQEQRCAARSRGPPCRGQSHVNPRLLDPTRDGVTLVGWEILGYVEKTRRVSPKDANSSTFRTACRCSHAVSSGARRLGRRTSADYRGWPCHRWSAHRADRVGHTRVHTGSQERRRSTS